MTIFDLSGSNYSETDASNNNAAPAGMPEGMAPSGVNDAWRSGMGAVKRTWDRDHAGTAATVGGTANAITLAYPVAPAAYVQGEKFAFVATGTNTGATTANVNSLGGKNVYKKSAAGIVACTGSEIVTGDIVELEYDGTQFQICGGAANAGFAETSGTIASAGTVAIGAAAANYLQITGTTTITAFDTVLAGTRRIIEFAGILTLTHNATSLILPGAANITTAAGDVAIMVSEGSGNWRCASYTRVPGVPAAKADMQAGTSNALVVTPARAGDHDGAAKAWVVFDGSAAVGSITPTASFNVASVTKSATGRYVITFSTAFSSANYAMSGSIQDDSGTGQVGPNVDLPAGGAAAGSCKIYTYNSGVGQTDSSRVSAIFYGRQ